MKHITLALTEMQEGDLRVAILARIRELQQHANDWAEVNALDDFTRFNDQALELSPSVCHVDAGRAL